MKALVIEDLDPHKELLKRGISSTNLNFEILDYSIEDILDYFSSGLLLDKIDNEIDFFVIDVGLRGGQDELGLEILNYLIKSYKHQFKYIVTSIWDRSEYETKISIPDECFIDKNNFMGFELIYETKCKIINLFKK